MPTPSPVLPARSDDYLRALAKYGFLTADQLTRLHHKMGSKREVLKRMATLRDEFKFVTCDRRPRDDGNPYGRLLYLYKLHDAGKKYVRTLGVLPRRVETLGTAFHVDHRIEVNDFLISAELLAQGRDDICLQYVLMESDLRHDYFVTEVDGRRFAVIPDAWLDFRQGEWQTCISLETDRGSEEERHWRQRIAAMTKWIGKPYINRFGTESLTIAVIVTKGHHGIEPIEVRAQRLLQWTESVLEEQDAHRLGAFFKIAPVKPCEVDPAHLFFAPIFAQPFHEGGVSLLGE